MKHINLTRYKILSFYTCLFIGIMFAHSFRALANGIELTTEERAYLNSKESIKMCVGIDFLPYEDIVDGIYVGMISEYMTIFSDHLHIPFHLVVTESWDETMSNAKSRRCDIVTAIIPTEERKVYLNFTQSYFGEPFVIATTEDKPFVVEIEDILDKKLGVVRGYAYVEIYRKKFPSINIIEVDSAQDGLTKLANGEIFGYMGGLNIIGYNLQKMGLESIKINGTIGDYNDLSIGSRNDQPILNRVLNKAIDSMSKTDVKRIQNSWMRIRYEHGFDYRLIVQISFLAFLLFGFMLYHQNTLRKHNRILEALSETDKLTGLNNRLKLDKFLQYHLDLFVRYHDAFSIILIDIDYFKKFNDTYGHLIGDKVLAHVAELMKENCRKLDMIGRWGGEEFLMICPKTKLKDVKTLAETLRLKVENSHLENVEGVTISLGVAQIKVSDNFNTIISRADKALFAAKEKGRNKVEDSSTE